MSHLPALAPVIEAMNYMGAAMAPAQERYRNVVMVDTWGHLAPEPRRKYAGTILFADGEYNDRIPIRTRFEDLPDSPWFYEQMMDFIHRASSKCDKPGTVYLFIGTYMMFKNGNCRFAGKVTMVA